MLSHILYPFTAENVKVPVQLLLSKNEITFGEVLFIKCRSLYPTTGVSLKHNGVAVGVSSRITTTSGNTYFNYTIDPVELEDAGVYTCFPGSQSLLETDSEPQTLLVGCKLQL